MKNQLILATALALVTPMAFCQQTPGTPDAQPDQGPQKQHFEMRMERKDGGDPPREFFFAQDGGPGDQGPRREHGKHGEWWKNPMVAKELALTPDQIKKLDDLSLQGKIAMIHLHATLAEQELLLKPILEAPTPDEKKADLQIDKIAESRAAIEKEGVKQRLAIDGVLTPEQRTKLKDHGGMHHQGPNGGQPPYRALCPGCPPGGGPGGPPQP